MQITVHYIETKPHICGVMMKIDFSRAITNVIQKCLGGTTGGCNTPKQLRLPGHVKTIRQSQAAIFCTRPSIRSYVILLNMSWHDQVSAVLPEFKLLHPFLRSKTGVSRFILTELELSKDLSCQTARKEAF